LKIEQGGNLKGFVTIKWQVVDFFKDLFKSHAESSQLQGQTLIYHWIIFTKVFLFANQVIKANCQIRQLHWKWGILINRKRKKKSCREQL